MKKRRIVLNINNVLQRIYTHCYYTGEARKQVGFPEKAAANIQASSDDKTQIIDHINTPTGEVSRMLSRYFALCSRETASNDATEDTNNTVFLVDIPQNYPDEAVPQLETMIENYIVMRTLQLWMLQHKPDEAAIAASEVQQIIFNLREMFTLRKRPQIQQSNSHDKLINM